MADRTDSSRDLRHDVILTLEEAVSGAERTIRFQRWEFCKHCKGTGAGVGADVATCPQCHGGGQTSIQRTTFPGTFVEVQTCSRCRGTGRVVTHPCPSCGSLGRVQQIRERNVRIPAGVDTDMRMPLRGEGNVGERGESAGDVYLVFEVQDHAVFERDGNDLFCQVSISIPQAALGTTITVPLIDGKDEMRVPEGTQSGHRFTLRGRGVPDVSGRGKGDLHVVVQVEVPRNLTSEQREIFKQLATTLGEKEEQKNKGLFGKLFPR